MNGAPDKAQAMGDFPQPPKSANADAENLAATAEKALKMGGGPGLSKRATSGPDPGPLIERMAELFNNCPSGVTYRE